MRKDLVDFLYKMRKCEYSELLGIAEISVERTFDIMNKYAASKAEAADALSLFLVNALSADGRFSEKEDKLITDLLGDSKLLTERALRLDEKQRARCELLIDGLSGDELSDFCMLAIVIASVDESIGIDELKYLDDLLSK